MAASFATLYDVVKARLTGEPFNADVNVTHYALEVGEANSTTGVPAVTYAAGETIEMLLLSKAAQQIISDTGLYVKRDVLALTKDTVEEGDRVKDADDNMYTVISIQPNPVGDILVYYAVDLVYMPMLEAPAE